MSYEPAEDEDIFPKPYTPDWEALKVATSESQFSKAAFGLLQEAAQLVTVIASVKPHEPVTSRNEATLLGLVVKVSKLTRSIMRDTARGDVEQQFSTFRELLEAMVNLRWLLQDEGSGERYAMFIEAGLNAEKIMLETIQKNVDARGGEVLHIEKRMRKSINDTFKAAGIDDVDAMRSGKELKRQGYANVEDRVEALGEVAYFAYRSGSASVHTTWSDLYKHHLEYVDGAFEPNLDPPPRRPQNLTTTVSLVSAVLPEYVDHMLDDYAKSQIKPLLEDLAKRTSRLTAVHEAYLASKDKPKSTAIDA